MKLFTEMDTVLLHVTWC